MEKESLFTEEGYKAVKTKLHKTFTLALRDPVWGAPARNWLHKQMQLLKQIKKLQKIYCR
jgi:hypothetical protein